MRMLKNDLSTRVRFLQARASGSPPTCMGGTAQYQNETRHCSPRCHEIAQPPPPRSHEIAQLPPPRSHEIAQPPPPRSHEITQPRPSRSSRDRTAAARLRRLGHLLHLCRLALQLALDSGQLAQQLCVVKPHGRRGRLAGRAVAPRREKGGGPRRRGRHAGFRCVLEGVTDRLGPPLRLAHLPN
jgi:hypothetical protein